MEISTVQNIGQQKPPQRKWIFSIAVLLIATFWIWYFSSGIREGALQQSATSTTVMQTTTPKKQGTLEVSYYNNWIKFKKSPGVKETYPEKEYIEIGVVQPNLSGADATNWVLKNSQGEEALLGPASTLPFSGKVSAVEPLKLKADDRLFVSTGRSPIGVSFRVNKCSAYFEQSQDFIPPIPIQCPSVSSENAYSSLDGKCRMFIQSIPRCETNTHATPSDITGECRAFLNSMVNYTGCVTIHKNDFDFYTKEWRIFLGKEKELWTQPGGTITLLDEKGRLIDTLTY